ncbi:unnamed protein product [Rotaria sp. Silwood2]|nr:unnamed protein product [Rotaria sp. Silwood2]CAF4529596.1 unnamed protein product [Rotaria sp. Silwood2]
MFNQPSSTVNQQLDHQMQVQSTTVPMENENDEMFVTVGRKKKKAKTDHVQLRTPSSTTSTSSTSCTDGSTSSTNTSSATSNVIPSTIPHLHPNKTTNNRPNTGSYLNEISQQSIRYAETRFAFPPFVVKFNESVEEKLMINNIMEHFTAIYKFNITLAGHRLKDKRELLLFAENRESFLMLYDTNKWPDIINSTIYELIKPNHLPPQFSVILRNVPVEKDVNVLLNELKEEYPDIVNAFRLTNKSKTPTSIVRLDICSVEIIEELLRKKFVYNNNLRLSVAEYLAPAKVLICSKCFQIGHFRSTCKSRLEFCKICGVGVDDLKQHKNCTKPRCCVRCSGDHESNDYRCPEVKSFRSLLTKSLLSAPGTINNIKKNSSTTNTTNYCVNDQDFPVLNGNRGCYHRGNESSISMGKRIDDLFQKLNKVEENFNRILELNNNSLNQLCRTQQVLVKLDHETQVQKLDVKFHHEFMNEFVSPLCQVLVEVLPILVKQNVIQDKTLLCSSLTGLTDKLANELPTWSTRYAQNEHLKIKLINDFNLINNDVRTDPSINNNVHHPSHTQ